MKTIASQNTHTFCSDAEFATYLGLASQADTARYVAGETGASYRAPESSQESPDDDHPPPLRLVPGSTPASFAYFTQIYPDDHSDGDIRIEHFSPVIHPTSAERQKARLAEEGDEPEPYDRSKSNYYPNDEAQYAPPTSRSYFGRYSNKQKYSESSEDDDKYGTKPGKLKSSVPSDGFDDDSTPDYKMGYRHVGMYHKIHEEDLFPKKTSSGWVPLKKTKLKSRHKSQGDRDEYDPESYHNPQVSEEAFHVKSEHDDEVKGIINSINNDPPHSTNNFDLDEGKVPSVGTFSKGEVFKGSDDYGKETPTEAFGDSPYEPDQRPQKHRRRKKKRKHHRHHHRRPGYRSSVAEEASAFRNQGRGADYKAPSFEFHKPVNTYIAPPYTPPETHKSNFEAEPHKDHELDAPSKDDFKPSSGPSGPSEPFRTSAESDLPLTGDADKDVSFEDPPEVPDEQADLDYRPVKPSESDEDYHIIGGAGPTEHTKDYDKTLPEDDKVYGSFETFDSLLDSEGNKKFEPFVKFPFDEQRKKLASVVEELIESGKSRRRK